MKLTEAIEQYTKQLEAEGKKPSTVKTTGRILKRLIETWGEQKELEKVLPVHVAGFFNGDATTGRGSEANASQSAVQTVLQIRRTVRHFLLWCQAQGWIKDVPLPKDEKEKLTPKKPGRKPAAEKKVATPKTEPDTDVETDPADKPADNRPRPAVTKSFDYKKEGMMG